MFRSLMLAALCGCSGAVADPLPHHLMPPPTAVTVIVHNFLTNVNEERTASVCGVKPFDVHPGILKVAEFDISGTLTNCPTVAVLQIGNHDPHDICQLDMLYASPGKAIFTKDLAFGDGITCEVSQLDDRTAYMYVNAPSVNAANRYANQMDPSVEKQYFPRSAQGPGH